MWVLDEKELTLIKVEEREQKLSPIYIFTLGISLILNILFLGILLFNKPIEETPQQHEIYYYNMDSITIDSIRNYTSKVRFGHILYAQILLESGGFKSELAIKANNLIGMRIPKKRLTTAVGEYKGYAVYNSWKDCVVDYILWQNSQMKGIKCEQAYLDRLSSIYASDTLYKNKIANIINQNKQ